MNMFWIALLVALALGGSMAVAGHVYGWHSTPVFWLALPNLPGIAVASWIMPYRYGDSVWIYPIWVLVNCAFYFLLIEGLMAVKRRFSD